MSKYIVHVNFESLGDWSCATKRFKVEAKADKYFDDLIEEVSQTLCFEADWYYWHDDTDTGEIKHISQEEKVENEVWDCARKMSTIKEAALYIATQAVQVDEL